MKTSENGINLITSHEGLRTRAYRCPAGVWTIGYGHTKGVKEGQVVTVRQAIDFLKEDLESAENTVSKHLPGINQNQFDALVSFVFNVGAGSFGRSTLLRKAKINPNDPSIDEEFAKWHKAGGESLKGLVRRRADEAKLYFS